MALSIASVYARPHPVPLPRGEGNARSRFGLFIGNCLYPVQGMKRKEYGAERQICPSRETKNISLVRCGESWYEVRMIQMRTPPRRRSDRTDFALSHVDCVKGMARLPGDFVDVVVTSPPYNLG